MEHLTFDSVDACHLTVDMVSKFSLRSCEFWKAFPQMRQFYRFFNIQAKSKKKISRINFHAISRLVILLMDYSTKLKSAKKHLTS